MMKKITINIVVAALCLLKLKVEGVIQKLEALFNLVFFRLYAGGHGTLKHQSTQSVLLFQLGSFAHGPGTIKWQNARAWSRKKRDRLGSFWCTGLSAIFFFPLLGKSGRSNGGSGVGVGSGLLSDAGGLTRLGFKVESLKLNARALIAILRRFFFRLYAGGHGTLKHQSTQSVLLFQLDSFAHGPGTIKWQNARAWSREKRDRLGSFLYTGLFAIFFFPLLGKSGRSNGGSGVGAGCGLLSDAGGLTRIVRSAERPKGKAYLLIILLMCIMSSQLWAQNKVMLSSEALKVGDKLPEVFWQQEHQVYQDGKTSVETLEKYKGKLLILDFWATWCSTCLKKMVLLDSIWHSTNGAFNVMLITRDGAEKIDLTLKHLDKEGKPLALPTLYEDRYLNLAFPHRFIPHYVWIDAKGIVVAVTGYDFMTAANIANLMERKGSKIIEEPLKK